MSALEPRTLRDEAARWLRAHRRDDVAALLEGAEIVLEPAVRRWRGSDGEHSAHRLTLRCDATALARLRAAPARVDALHEAFAVVLARAPGEGLDAVVLVWNGAVGTDGEHGHYRGASAGEQPWREALRVVVRRLYDDDTLRWLRAHEQLAPPALRTLARGEGAVGERVVAALALLGLE